MKCPNCGAEINSNSKYCEFCGTAVTMQMRKEQEQMNKVGCPRCKSTNIAFTREKQGEVKGKRGTAVVRSTVGMCKDCGYTWHTESDNQNAKKKKGWLRILGWILGWIYIFPIPITILMRRKKEMKPAIKYGIIAVAWLVYVAFFVGSICVGADTNDSVIDNQPVQNIVNSSLAEEKSHLYDDAEIKDVFNGFRTAKIGEYSVIFATKEECTEDALADWYFNFVATHDYNYNVIIFTDANTLKGCYSIKGMVEVGTTFDKDEYNDYMVGQTNDSVVYAPSEDGKTLTKIEIVSPN